MTVRYSGQNIFLKMSVKNKFNYIYIKNNMDQMVGTGILRCVANSLCQYHYLCLYSVHRDISANEIILNHVNKIPRDI